MRLLCIVIISYYISAGTCTQEEECTERFMEFNLVEYRADHIGIPAAGTNLDNEIRILEEYEFNCTTTNVTSVILGADVTDNDRLKFPSVQLWRPIPGNTDQYSIVNDSERIIYYSTSNVSTSGVFEFQLDPPISVNSGDLLAVSQPRHQDSVVRIYYIQGIPFRSYNESFDVLSSGLSSIISNQLVLVYPLTDGNCVNSSVTSSMVEENALRIHQSNPIQDGRQFIYPEIRFACNGSITKWIYGATSKQAGALLLPELQIWRQIDPVTYSKIGFSSLSDDVSIGTNLYQCIPPTPLRFRAGDIFGIYISQSQLVLYEQVGSGPLGLEVNGNVDSPLSDIDSSTLRSHEINFSLVTVEISASTTSMHPTTSTAIGQQGSGTITPLVVSVVIVALVLLVVVGLLILLLIFLYYQKRKGVKNKGPPTNDDTMYNNSLYDFRDSQSEFDEDDEVKEKTVVYQLIMDQRNRDSYYRGSPPLEHKLTAVYEELNEVPSPSHGVHEELNTPI